MTTASTHESAVFDVLHDQLPAKLEIVNAGVEAFAEELRQDVRGENEHTKGAVESYLSLLERGGKRTRGVLTITGYEMYAGDNSNVAAGASAAIEAIHASLLVCDDVADASDLRRDAPTAHRQLDSYFEKNSFVGDTKKLGEDTAQMAALYGSQKAQSVISQLDAPAERRIQAMTIVNEGIARTAIGQVLDILSAGNPNTSKQDILNVAESKTAYYSYLLPLQVGATLAGAPKEELEHFSKYSMRAGLAFQLQDDIIGIFGDEAITGKSRMSDIADGKKTLLMDLALGRSSDTERAFLLDALGNPNLQPQEFERCLEIVRSTGALAAAQEQIDLNTRSAHEALNNAPAHWPAGQIAFLKDMATYGAKRQK